MTARLLLHIGYHKTATSWMQQRLFVRSRVSVSLAGEAQPIAWQAHVGGFVAGLALFGWFDPVRRARG